MKSLSRSEAIELLRQRCTALVDDDHSLCQIAAQKKILCGGFSQWTFTELKERYDWIARKRPGITRAELEDLANRWQLARQFCSDSALACDNQQQETHHRICHGWDGHDDAELSRYCEELTGEPTTVVPDPAPSETADA